MSYLNDRMPRFISCRSYRSGGFSYGFVISCLLLSGLAWSDGNEAAPEYSRKVHLADTKKTNLYYSDGLITGGDQAIQDVVIKDIRRAYNPEGFDRIVIDLEGNRNGEPAELQRPPYYQVGILPKEKRLTITITGHPSLAFNAKKVLQSFKKSSVIQNVTLLPKVEDQLWTLSMSLQAGIPVEVFELNHPVRVILDLKNKKKPGISKKKN